MLDLIPHTKRRSMTKARAARIFLAHNGKCCNCGRQIKQGEKWFIEHPISLAQGGADDDTNTAPAHTKCKPAKDATDAASKAKRDRIVTAGWDRPKRSSFQSRGFEKRPPQNSATRPIIRKSERHEA
jgi:5-methylcytosine-specific restriction protein A